MSIQVVASMTAAEMDKLVPLNGNVLVEREPEAPTKHGLIVIPTPMDKRRFEPTICRVVRSGFPWTTKKGAKVAATVKPGERVMVTRFAGHDFEVDGRNFLVIDEADILFVLDPAA